MSHFALIVILDSSKDKIVSLLKEKSDGWIIGGKYKGFFLNKNGKNVSIIRKSEIDLDKMLIEQQNRDAGFYDMMTQIRDSGDLSDDGLRNFEEITKISTKMTREEYLQNLPFQNPITPFAIIKNGEWFQKASVEGSVLSYNENEMLEWNKIFNDIYNEFPEDAILLILDCHI